MRPVTFSHKELDNTVPNAALIPVELILDADKSVRKDI
jgi:hypothetical protein